MSGALPVGLVGHIYLVMLADNLDLLSVSSLQDILSRFNGCWSMSPIRNAEGTEVVGTAATLEQDILPAGMHLLPCHSYPQHHTLPGGVLFSLPSALQIDLMLTGKASLGR